jgi:hypothetical protein
LGLIWAHHSIRSHGGSQRKHDATILTINGSPIVELDYSEHHIRMLYNWEKIAYDKDPYKEL